MAKVVLHVFTKDPGTPWLLHFTMDGKVVTREYRHVRILCFGKTRNEGHEPCAHWYLEFEDATVAHDAMDDKIATIMDDREEEIATLIAAARSGNPTNLVLQEP